MNKLIFFLFSLITTSISAQSNIDFVNVFIGTDGTGHTFPGPSMPFGLVQPSPDNCDRGWNHTSGYQYQDSVVLGYSQTHLSGTGINELGDILLLPVVIGGEEHLAKSYFKESEKASVGYYSHVKKDGIKVELTCSERVALHKYTYPGNNAGVIVNFDHGLRFLTDSLVLESKVTIEDSLTLSGFCHTKNWVERKYFFTVVFDKPFIKIETNQSKSSKGAPKYLLNFILDDTKSLQIKVALSTVSVEGAKLDTFFNLYVENPDKFLGQEAMIGQYAHGNEPSHHILYLYAYSDSPLNAQKYIHQVINNFHNNTPDGMIGNDDCGQMSAWYILSSLGFYPVNPTSGEFVLGAPQVRKARLHLANGRSFSIEAKNIYDNNIFSDKVFLNGNLIKRPIITFQDIQKGGSLIFEMKALTGLPDSH